MDENRLNVLLTLTDKNVTTEEVKDLINSYSQLRQQEGINTKSSIHEFKLFIMDLCQKTLDICIKFPNGIERTKEQNDIIHSNLELLTPEQVSIILKCTPQYVRRLIKEGKIKGVKYSQRITRVNRKDLDDYINSMNNSRKKK